MITGRAGETRPPVEAETLHPDAALPVAQSAPTLTDQGASGVQETPDTKVHLSEANNEWNKRALGQAGMWERTAQEMARNLEYYRGLVIECGEHLGPAAKTCDDGSVVPDVLCAKVPELVAAAQEEIARLGKAWHRVLDRAERAESRWEQAEADLAAAQEEIARLTALLDVDTPEES